VYSLVYNEISFFLEAFIATIFSALKKLYYSDMHLLEMKVQSKPSSEFSSTMAFEYILTLLRSLSWILTDLSMISISFHICIRLILKIWLRSFQTLKIWKNVNYFVSWLWIFCCQRLWSSSCWFLQTIQQSFWRFLNLTFKDLINL
jgi:hypothetical protein